MPGPGENDVAAVAELVPDVVLHLLAIGKLTVIVCMLPSRLITMLTLRPAGISRSMRPKLLCAFDGLPVQFAAPHRSRGARLAPREHRDRSA